MDHESDVNKQMKEINTLQRFNFSMCTLKWFSSNFVCLLWISTYLNSDMAMLKIPVLLVTGEFELLYSICVYSKTLLSQT